MKEERKWTDDLIIAILGVIGCAFALYMAFYF